MPHSSPVFDEVVRRFSEVDPSSGDAVDWIGLARRVGVLPRTSLDDSPPIQSLAARGKSAAAFYVIDTVGRALIVAAWPCGTVKIYDTGPIDTECSVLEAQVA